MRQYLSKEELIEGECTVVLQRESGRLRYVKGFFNKKLNLVFVCYSEHEKIIGYKQGV